MFVSIVMIFSSTFEYMQQVSKADAIFRTKKMPNVNTLTMKAVRFKQDFDDSLANLILCFSHMGLDVKNCLPGM